MLGCGGVGGGGVTTGEGDISVDRDATRYGEHGGGVGPGA